VATIEMKRQLPQPLSTAAIELEDKNIIRLIASGVPTRLRRAVLLQTQQSNATRCNFADILLM